LKELSARIRANDFAPLTFLKAKDLNERNTMKLAVAASLIASAAAFAPAAKQASSTAIQSYENELGVIVRIR
jgi:hypothetical protein